MIAILGPKPNRITRTCPLQARNSLSSRLNCHRRRRRRRLHRRHRRCYKKKCLGLYRQETCRTGESPACLCDVDLKSTKALNTRLAGRRQVLRRILDKMIDNRLCRRLREALVARGFQAHAHRSKRLHLEARRQMARAGKENYSSNCEDYVPGYGI